MSLEEELRAVINRNSAENGSGTPDFILAHYMMECLSAFNAAVNRREAWYGREQNGFAMPVVTEDDLSNEPEAWTDRLGDLPPLPRRYEDVDVTITEEEKK